MTLDTLADLLVQTGSIPAWICPDRARVRLYVSARRSIAASRARRLSGREHAARLLATDTARLRRTLAEMSDGRCMATVMVSALRWEAHRTAKALEQPIPRITYQDAARAVRAAVQRFVDGVEAPVAWKEAA